MTFRPIDSASAALAADAGLASAILTYVAESGAQTLTDCTRSCTATYDYRHPPLLHSIPGFDSTGAIDPDQQLGWIPYLWVAGPGATGVTVRVRMTRAVGSGTLGLHITDLASYVRGRRLPDAVDTDANGAGETTVTMTATYPFVEGEAYVIAISWASTAGTAEWWFDANTVDGGGAPTGGSPWGGWYDSFIYADQASTYWSNGVDAPTAHADTTAPYAVEVLDGVTYDVAAWGESKASTAEVLPQGRLAFRQEASFSRYVSAKDAIFVWPPMPDRLSDVVVGLTAAQTWVRRTPLSYAKIHGVEIIETVLAPAALGTRYAPEQPASHRAGTGAGLAAAHVIGVRSRVWAIGTLPDYVYGSGAGFGDIASSDDARGNVGYSQLAHTLTRLSTTKAVIQSIPWAEALEYTSGGVGYVQHEVDVLLVCHVLVVGGRLDQTVRLAFDAHSCDYDSTTRPTDYEEVVVDDAPCLVWRAETVADPTAAYWWGFAVPNTTDGTVPVRHSGEAMVNGDVLATDAPIVVRLRVPHAAARAQGVEAKLLVRARVLTTGNQQPFPAGARVYLRTTLLSVVAVPTLLAEHGAAT